MSRAESTIVAEKPLSEWSTKELADTMRTIFDGMNRDRLREIYHPEVTANDLSRVGKKTQTLSAPKRKAWERIVRAWIEGGKPDPYKLAELLGKKWSDRVDALTNMVTHPAWDEVGVDQKKRIKAALRIAEDAGYTDEDRRALRDWSKGLEGEPTRADAEHRAARS